MTSKTITQRKSGSLIIGKVLHFYVGSSIGAASAVKYVVFIFPHVVFPPITVLHVPVSLLCT